MAEEPMNEPTTITHPVDARDPSVAEELLPLVYQDLRRLAAARMARERDGHTLQATALVHEAWLALIRSGDPVWKNRAHFFGSADEAMRRVLIGSARRKAQLKRGGDWKRVELEDIPLADSSPHEKALLINEALVELERQDSEKARVVVLKFFGGLTNQEVATRLGVTERTVGRHWAYAKAWLFRRIRKTSGTITNTG
jgi:RNA polymerase sigma factor (TIGR02999 family)